MRKTILVFGMLGILVMSCKNNEKKMDTTPSVEKSTENPAVHNNASDMHTSQIALDWVGTYEGTLPCASCEGIKTKISLTADGTYNSDIEYMGEEDGKFTENGKFKWNAKGDIITLQMADGGKQMYKVEENAIVFLNSDGEVNTGQLAAYYVLPKK
ncbi:hypothetical protein KCTC52924_03453 [Arenibacter antarcticus]|uniref:Copper resistance protein NlpE n=1 Tax=Arenibacter antarcticus TaxID=2040469 RepID=A0ABW5VFZ7_9FLAO|nr:copper resistance protein NlpE [Arenibacter sp. H213]MCM4166517.1 copper resistance protein NlpE [Arenibacter sp. H213]